MLIDGKEIIDVYITKYAFTGGIFVRKAYICNDIDPDMICVVEVSPDGLFYKDHGHGMVPYFHKNEWFRTQEEAINKANDMKAKKIKSLERKIKQLKNITSWKMNS